MDSEARVMSNAQAAAIRSQQDAMDYQRLREREAAETARCMAAQQAPFPYIRDNFFGNALRGPGIFGGLLPVGGLGQLPSLLVEPAAIYADPPTKELPKWLTHLKSWLAEWLPLWMLAAGMSLAIRFVMGGV